MEKSPNHDLIVRSLKPDEREQYEERAAFRENEGGYSRDEAEALALSAVIDRMGEK